LRKEKSKVVKTGIGWGVSNSEVTITEIVLDPRRFEGIKKNLCRRGMSLEGE